MKDPHRRGDLTFCLDGFCCFSSSPGGRLVPVCAEIVDFPAESRGLAEFVVLVLAERPVIAQDE